MTHYSDKIPGDVYNYQQAVRFDVTEGYVGISLFEGDTSTDRVLLTPTQLRALIAFHQRQKRARATRQEITVTR